MRTSRKKPLLVAVIGTGLIGASIGLALRRAYGRGVEIAGWDRDPRALQAARRRAAITKMARSLDEAVSEAGIIFLATPLEAVVAMLPEILRTAKPAALIIDVAGVKRPVVSAAKAVLRRRRDIAFVSCHPLAGREHAGAANADAALFDGRPFAMIRDGAQPLALRRAERLVRRLGAKPVRLTAAEHDRIVAATSALPQLAALALALAVDGAHGRARLLSGPGFEGATRLAASPYSVWASALAANRGPVMRALRRLRSALEDVADAARQSDGRPMERLFRRAAAARRRVAGD